MKTKKAIKKEIRGISLFANVGIAETYLDNINVKIVAANEIDSERAAFYSMLYPNVKMIVGDIKDSEVQKKLIKCAHDFKVNLIMATPPCQGMSTAGKKNNDDPRNSLICEAVELVKKIKPEYVFFENVPEQLKTTVNILSKNISIPDYIKMELSKFYTIKCKIVNASDYGVAQNRERVIFLLTNKKISQTWEFPKKSEKIITMKDAIGDLPSLDPLVSDISYSEQIKLFPLYEAKKAEGLLVSKWHYPPSHVYRQVIAMMHTPTGCTAFDNKDEYQPKKINGEKVKGYKNTYKRQEWDKPAFTVTMYNRTIGSQNNVHPGREIGMDDEGDLIYSDARVLTIFELMRIMSLPDDWQIPSGFSENFIRSVIGEGIPPLLCLKIMEMISNEI